MNNTSATHETPVGIWSSSFTAEALRDRLVEFALSRRIVAVRYSWKSEVFKPLLIGRISLVQSAYVAILMSLRSEVRFVPLSAIVSVEPLVNRRPKNPPEGPP
jgi:hypothetical protein